MSHFTVMVIGNNPDEQLAPFNEGIEVPEYCRREISEEDKIQMLDYYKKKHNEEYSSFDECYEAKGEDWNDNSWRKDEDGVWKEYSTYNPDSKWDWYSLGGRWSGKYIKLKQGSTGIKSESGTGGNIPGIDQTHKKDIDFERIIKEARESAKEHYRKIVKACGGEIPKLNVSAPNRRTDLPKDADYKRLWEEYHNQESVSVFQDKTGGDLQLDDYQCSEEEFIQRGENAAFTTFAYVKDGQWHGRRTMGWWASVSNPMNEDEWNKQMREMVEALPDNTLISIYDCHI